MANYYETYLYPEYYEFCIDNGNKILIDFDKERFCHLIGIEQVAKAKFNSGDKRRFMYKGSQGFRRAKNGRLELNHLRALHQHELTKQMEKFRFFHFLHRMLEASNLNLVSYVPISGSTITCDFMFYDTYDNALLHLGVEKLSSSQHFFPKTFIVRYLSRATANKYIAPQTPVGISKLTKIPRL